MHSDRVIEVARGLAVNRDDGQSTKIATLVRLPRRNDGFRILRFFEYLGRKAMRQVKLADHDLDVHAEVIGIAENLHYASAGTLRGGGPVGDLDVDNDVFQIVPLGAAGSFFA